MLIIHRSAVRARLVWRAGARRPAVRVRRGALRTQTGGAAPSSATEVWAFRRPSHSIFQGALLFGGHDRACFEDGPRSVRDASSFEPSKSSSRTSLETPRRPVSQIQIGITCLPMTVASGGAGADEPRDPARAGGPGAVGQDRAAQTALRREKRRHRGRARTRRHGRRAERHSCRSPHSARGQQAQAARRRRRRRR